MRFKLFATSVALLTIPLLLAGCAGGDNFNLSMEQQTSGLPLTVDTYNFNGQKIDQIEAKHVNIHTDDTMSQNDDNGNELSDVIDVDYGKHRTIHVGASMIAAQGLKNYVDKYNHAHVNVNDQSDDKSIPFINRYYDDFQNFWGHGQTGAVVFVKSQSGEPIGAFYGKNVSIHQADNGSGGLFNDNMKDATYFTIDGHRLFLYRCDYTTYPVSVLKKSAQSVPKHVQNSGNDENDYQ